MKIYLYWWFPLPENIQKRSNLFIPNRGNDFHCFWDRLSWRKLVRNRILQTPIKVRRFWTRNLLLEIRNKITIWNKTELHLISIHKEVHYLRSSIKTKQFIVWFCHQTDDPSKSGYTEEVTGQLPLPWRKIKIKNASRMTTELQMGALEP